MDFKLYAKLISRGYDSYLARILSICYRRGNVSEDDIINRGHIRVTNPYNFLIITCLNRRKAIAKSNAKRQVCRYPENKIKTWNNFIDNLKQQKDNDSKEIYHYITQGIGLNGGNLR